MEKASRMSRALPTQPEALLPLAKSGRADALGALLEVYRPYLTLLARVQIGRHLQSKVDEADLVQETYLEAHRSFPRFRGLSVSEFAAWLREILVCRLAMQVRRFFGTQRRNADLERALQQDVERSSRVLDRGLVAPDTSPSQRAHREVIVLRHVEGLPFAEVARRMGRSVDAVEKLWARSLVRLRHNLTQVAE
jgi:RNA polymerase sigma-70 factor (ECF subfamily)